jgi:nucleotide-binding universal stress UspA family protein
MPFGDAGLPTGWIREEQAKLREYLEGASAKARGRAPDVRVTAHIRVGRVSLAVQELAKELEADLLMLTTHGRGAFKRSWLGSVADQLLRRVEQPLLLLRHREDGRRRFDLDSVRHVLVPLDGSEAAECAVDALQLVLPRAGGVRVTLAYVVEEGFPMPIQPPLLPAKSMREECEIQAEAYLRRAAAKVDLKGVAIVETRVLFADNPGQGLLRFCDDAVVDLIAMSTHGAGGVSRFLLGSVADKVVRGATVPVLAVKCRMEERN